MRDIKTDGLILAKVMHRKRFILGKSVTLSATEVAQMDNGDVRIISHRRPEYWTHNPKAPMAVSFTYSGKGGFAGACNWLRDQELMFITNETPLILVQR